MQNKNNLIEIHTSLTYDVRSIDKHQLYTNIRIKFVHV